MPFVTSVAASLVINPSFSADSGLRHVATWCWRHHRCLSIHPAHEFHPHPFPIFTATITHIVGWGGGHATAGILTYQGPCTICLPLRICRLFWWQRLWDGYFLSLAYL
ncbi:hypothetical protein BDR07DRAFT_1442615 [Suillus spraguei]|nr:hypothetical protein BDR07DRAFT_1442615 [Suillus spraguei]